MRPSFITRSDRSPTNAERLAAWYAAVNEYAGEAAVSIVEEWFHRERAKPWIANKPEKNAVHGDQAE
jgi:hypothetical protein